MDFKIIRYFCCFGAQNLWFLFPLAVIFKVKTSLFEWKHCHISLKWGPFLPICTSFWMKKGVIWWLFHDNLRAREQEREEKGTTNPAPFTINKQVQKGFEPYVVAAASSPLRTFLANGKNCPSLGPLTITWHCIGSANHWPHFSLAQPKIDWCNSRNSTLLP